MKPAVLNRTAVLALLAGAALLSAPLAFANPVADVPVSAIKASAAIDAAVASPARAVENRKRDGARHPAQTLAFFKVAPGKTVVEITPGAGWYSEILAPLVGEKGQYIAAVVDPQAVAEGRGRDYQQRSRDGLQAKFAAAPTQFGHTTVVSYDPAKPVFGPASSADVVLTFRNVHNWRKAGQAEGMFQGFFNVLKPGGVLGVVEHRAKADVAEDDDTGYVGQQQVIALAKAAGFVLDASTEVNANPRDTKDHVNGVWTLPPVNNHPATDAARYQAIGESDRMTLRFVKPAG